MTVDIQKIAKATFRIAFVAQVLIFAAPSASAQMNTVITDGGSPFAEGVLNGYVVQANGQVICNDPFVIGRYISCRDQISRDGMTWHASSHQQVWVETNGVLGAVIVVDRNGSTVCQDPMVWNQFRGPLSYIVCNGD